MKKVYSLLMILFVSFFFSACEHDMPTEPKNSDDDVFSITMNKELITGDTIYVVNSIPVNFLIKSTVSMQTWAIEFSDTNKIYDKPDIFKKFVLESRVLSKNFSMVINALDIYGVNHQTIKTIKVQKDPDLFIQKIGTTLAGKARVRLYALKSAMYYSGLTGYFIEGDFTAWARTAVSQTIMVDGKEYLFFDVELSPGTFTFGFGTYYNNGNSSFWPRLATPYYSASDQKYGFVLNSDLTISYLGGAVINPEDYPWETVGDEFFGRKISGDTLKLFFNNLAWNSTCFSGLAINSQIKTRTFQNQVQSRYLETTWGMRTFILTDTVKNIYIKFGPNINNPLAVASYTSSVFYSAEYDCLALQVIQIISSKGVVSWMLKRPPMKFD